MYARTNRNIVFLTVKKNNTTQTTQTFSFKDPHWKIYEWTTRVCYEWQTVLPNKEEKLHIYIRVPCVLCARVVCCFFFIMRVFYTIWLEYTYQNTSSSWCDDHDDDGIKLDTRHGLKDVEARNLKQFIITIF